MGIRNQTMIEFKTSYEPISKVFYELLVIFIMVVFASIIVCLFVFLFIELFNLNPIIKPPIYTFSAIILLIILLGSFLIKTIILTIQKKNWNIKLNKSDIEIIAWYPFRTSQIKIKKSNIRNIRIDKSKGDWTKENRIMRTVINPPYRYPGVFAFYRNNWNNMVRIELIEPMEIIRKRNEIVNFIIVDIDDPKKFIKTSKKILKLE